MMKFKDLKEYFNEIYIDDIFSACDAFFKKNKDSFALYTREIPYP